MIRLIFYTIILATILGGCARHSPRPPTVYEPTQKERNAADYGPYPSNYKQLITDFFQTRLKDPLSAQYRYVGEPFKWFRRAATPSEVIYYYNVKVFVNSKNSYGGYVGEHKYNFYIRDGQIVDHYDHNEVQKKLDDIDRYLNRNRY
ncbi:hypothetical protein [methanotrophic endosymbiont of Bathymodiolus puteoserpentis (Logatchev)]|jgi:hypothetical protein|uniref:hypothetical protein n=1 Tax=methanotrophic endosymbiont of Bathymodiolus puteoserpentis (Logatchev) TaxID=343235 RepID=UPI00157AF74F|nr:hypothetical protein [methanotrophic endosymbiont of Bathymodiolus puteoserpentis (Logatchev)]